MMRRRDSQAQVLSLFLLILVILLMIHPGMAESASENSDDMMPPVVTASITGNILNVAVHDDSSGVAGVQVNSMLFTTIKDDVLEIELDQNMNKFEKLAVRAFDYAGNFSEPVSMENPLYVEPSETTPAPTATAKATMKPTASPQTTSTVTSEPKIIYVTPVPTTKPLSPTSTPRHGLGSSLINVSDDEWPVTTADPTIVPVPTPQIVYVTPAPTPEPIIQTEYITISPGMPYKADGNSHTLDVLYSAATNKQFISLQSKNGNTFYLVIDYDKPIDEEADLYETYFLNLVDERDLLALMSDEEKEEVPTPTPQIVYVTPAPTTAPAPTAVPENPDQNRNSDKTVALLALAGILIIGCAGVVIWMRIKGKNVSSRMDNDFDLDDDDEDEGASGEDA